MCIICTQILYAVQNNFKCLNLDQSLKPEGMNKSFCYLKIIITSAAGNILKEIFSPILQHPMRTTKGIQQLIKYHEIFLMSKLLYLICATAYLTHLQPGCRKDVSVIIFEVAAKLVLNFRSRSCWFYQELKVWENHKGFDSWSDPC